MMVMQNLSHGAQEMAGLSISGLGAREEVSAKFDLTLTISEGEQKLSVSLGYNIDLFEAATIERMLGHFERLLENVVRNPERMVGRLRLLTEAERRQMLHQW